MILLRHFIKIYHLLELKLNTNPGPSLFYKSNGLHMLLVSQNQHEE